jgi:signal transduction histidine kinase
LNTVVSSNVGDTKVSGEHHLLVTNLPPTPQHSRWALAGTAVLLIGFGVLAPFAGEPLAPLYGFIPAIDATIFVTDLITAIMLFALFSISSSRALLALACGYFFSALIVVAHALSFPGGFPPTENLGGVQTPLRLYIFWHLGSAAALLIYAWLNGDERTTITRAPVVSAIGWSIAGVFGLACALVWLSTAGARFLPSLHIDPNHFSPVPGWVFPSTMLICATPLAALWIRRRSALDQWLMVGVLASIVELALTALLGVAPFSLGFYTGRIFSLVTSTVVLVVLLIETTKLYARLALSNMMLERERDSKLMNARAITAAIAHEVRQPLAAITTNAGAALRWLARMPPDHDEVRAALDRIKSEGYRAGEVFESIRAVFGKAGLAGQPVDVNDIILSVMRSLQGELKDHGVVVQRELAVELPPIAGHGGQLREVIFNLVNNAVEAMDATTSRTRILRMKTELRSHDAIVVSVQDSGPGIDPNKLDGIFSAFVTTKKRGTGLGLAICRMIVEHHGGQLTASSDGSSGALFQFVLPIKDMAATRA